MKIEIRKANPEDAESIKRLNQELFNYEYTNFDKTLDCSWPEKKKDYFQKAIGNNNYLALIAIIDKKVIGYLIGNIINPESYRKIGKIAEIQNTFILEKYRGHHIGKMLFDKFIEWSKEKEAKKIKVVASSKNEKAISFYKKCGFSDYSLTLEGEI